MWLSAGLCLASSDTFSPNAGWGDCVYHAIAGALNAFGETGRDGGPRSHRQLHAFGAFARRGP